MSAKADNIPYIINPPPYIKLVFNKMAGYLNLKYRLMRSDRNKTNTTSVIFICPNSLNAHAGNFFPKNNRFFVIGW